jgi:hypothetical protein
LLANLPHFQPTVLTDPPERMPTDTPEWSLLATLTGERVTVTIGQDTVFSANGAVHKAAIMSAPMAQTHSSRPRRFRRVALIGLCGLAIVGLAGCEDPQIKKYSAAREKITPDFTRLGSYKVPEGWTRLNRPQAPGKDPNKDPSLQPLATFEVRKGDKSVLVTVSRLPGGAGGLSMNIMRWRGQIGFPKATTDEEFDKELKEIREFEEGLPKLMVDGEKAAYVDLINPRKKDAGRILGVAVERGPVTWFFKMHGPGELVEQEQKAFKEFVESVKFGGTGANDG